MREASRLWGYASTQEPEMEQDMPNVASILKQEIARVARKEAKSFFKALPGSLSGLKKTVSEQKRKIAALEAKVAKLEKALAKDSKIALPKPEELEHSRLGAKNVAKLRKKLDLTRAEMAKLIGVNPNSVFLWENGKATPRTAAKAKIIALRGLGKKEIRKMLGDLEPKSETAPTAKPAVKRKKARKAKAPQPKGVEAPKQEASAESPKPVKKPSKKAKKVAKSIEPSAEAPAAAETASESSKA